MKKILITPVLSEIIIANQNYDKIKNIIDCFEYRELSLGITTKKKKIFHSSFRIELNYSYKELQETIMCIKKQKFENVSFHLASISKNPIIKNGMFYNNGRILDKHEIKNNVKNNIRYFRNIFGDKIKISIENNNYYPTGAYELITESNFINNLVEENKINILLDLAHLRITAYNRKENVLSYMNSFNSAKINQIHISSPKIKNNIMMDMHNSLEKTDWDILYYTLKICKNVKYITIEYYQCYDIYLEMTRNLRDII